jgi:protein canopy 1/2
MDDYARARYKSNGKLTIIKFMIDGGMNPEMSKVDFIQDEDLNKSLKHLVSKHGPFTM